jgi:hypothetical protein
LCTGIVAVRISNFVVDHEVLTGDVLSKEKAQGAAQDGSVCTCLKDMPHTCPRMLRCTSCIDSNSIDRNNSMPLQQELRSLWNAEVGNTCNDDSNQSLRSISILVGISLRQIQLPPTSKKYIFFHV